MPGLWVCLWVRFQWVCLYLFWLWWIHSLSFYLYFLLTLCLVWLILLWMLFLFQFCWWLWCVLSCSDLWLSVIHGFIWSFLLFFLFILFILSCLTHVILTLVVLPKAYCPSWCLTCDIVHGGSNWSLLSQLTFVCSSLRCDQLSRYAK